MEHRPAAHVTVVGQPSYDGIEGGQGEFYSSAVLMRGATAATACRLLPTAAPCCRLDALRGKRLAFNGPDSMSGILALTRDLEAAGESLAIFADRLETGSHRGSIVAVAEGRADVCAIDCRSWQLGAPARAARPGGSGRRLDGEAQGSALITSLQTPPETLAKICVPRWLAA